MPSKLLRTSCYNPITKKVICKSIVVKDDEDEEEVKKRLVEWRETTKKAFKLKKAQDLVNDDIINNMDNDSDMSDLEEEDDNPYKVHQLDLKFNHDEGSVIVFLGSSKSGKTYLWKKIYNDHFKDEDYCTVVYAANLQAPIYQDLSKEIITIDKFVPEIPKIQNAIQKGTNVKKYKFLNILDDCVDNSTKNSMILKKLMVSLRNKKISSFLSFQYSTMMNKQNRSNAHYVFCLHMSSSEATEDVIRKYLRAFLGGVGKKKKSMDQMIKLYEKLTSNYQFILIETGTNKITVNKI